MPVYCRNKAAENKHPCYYIFIKLIYIYLSYNSAITDIEHSPNYTAFGLPQTHQLR